MDLKTYAVWLALTGKNDLLDHLNKNKKLTIDETDQYFAPALNKLQNKEMTALMESPYIFLGRNFNLQIKNDEASKVTVSGEINDTLLNVVSGLTKKKPDEVVKEAIRTNLKLALGRDAEVTEIKTSEAEVPLTIEDSEPELDDVTTEPKLDDFPEIKLDDFPEMPDFEDDVTDSDDKEVEPEKSVDKEVKPEKIKEEAKPKKVEEKVTASKETEDVQEKTEAESAKAKSDTPEAPATQAQTPKKVEPDLAKDLKVLAYDKKVAQTLKDAMTMLLDELNKRGLPQSLPNIDTKALSV